MADPPPTSEESVEVIDTTEEETIDFNDDATDTMSIDLNADSTKIDGIGLVTGARGWKDRLQRPDTNDALILSYVSLAFNGVAVVLGLVVAIVVGSPAVLAYSFENAIDLASSVLLVWRFGGSGTATAEVLEMREKRASVGIAIAMCVLGVFVLIVASSHGECARCLSQRQTKPCDVSGVRCQVGGGLGVQPEELRRASSERAAAIV